MKQILIVSLVMNIIQIFAYFRTTTAYEAFHTSVTILLIAYLLYLITKGKA